MRQRGVAVGQPHFVPSPFVCAMALIQCQQPPCQFLAHLACPAVTGKPLQVLVDADEGEGPGPWTGRVENGEQCLLEHPASHTMEGWRVRTAQHSAQRP